MCAIDPKPRDTGTSSHNGGHSILNSQEERQKYQNIYRFLNRTDVDRDAKIDRARFFKDKKPVFEREFHEQRSSSASCFARGSHAQREAEVIIVEEIDPECLREFLATRIHNDAQRQSFLTFVDEYLHDHPSFNFTDVEYRIRAAPSVQNKQQHELLIHIQLRELDRPFKMSYFEIQNSARESRALRSSYAYGPLNPVQRPPLTPEDADFPPLAVTRASLAIWFDGDPWDTCVILVDKRVPFVGLPGQERPSRYVVGAHVYTGHTSMRSLIMDCFQNNKNLRNPGIPAPFTVTQDLRSIIGYDWLRIVGFVTRDLYSIHWALQGGDRMSDENNQELYRTALQHLFSIDRRLAWYCGLIQEQLDSCRSKGKLLWNGKSLGLEQVRVADVVSEELVMDFEDIKAQITQTNERLDKSISYVNGQVNVKEVERANAQSKIVLALAVVGGFFLPISTIAAIFSMADDWAPGKDGFGQFWAICIPISALVMVILVMIIRWSTILRWMGRLRRASWMCIEGAV
ncbi:unnamed protein product [Clonostachys chloroleuca]|uniref:Uncharacterized protein n=1 Tax=Clonostachys chloroleuca TaxID=1926264 RepID=A0AA35QEL5_9HYPO|nr:unnamed protein product [Clonostachys chloroleuca]